MAASHSCAKKLIKIAQSKIPRASIIYVDAEIFDFSSKNFDLAIANLSVQWFKNFELFLEKILFERGGGIGLLFPLLFEWDPP